MNQKITISTASSLRKKNNRPQKSTKKKSRRNTKSRPSSKTSTSTAKKDRLDNKKLSVNSPRKSRDRVSNAKKKRQHNQTIKVSPPIALIFRLAILTIGISTILGSIISVANSLNSDSILKNRNSSSLDRDLGNSKSTNLENRFSVVSVGREIIPLKKQLQTVTQKYSQLDAGILVADVENKDYVNLAATETFSAASTIKIPILVAFFQDVDAGKIDLNRLLTVTEQNIAKGSGYIQYQPVGSKFSAIETATSMITVSDNTATNMLIEHLGGAEALNQRFADWGLNATKINNLLPDLNGTNTTSPEDLSNLLLKIDRGELVSANSKASLLNIMEQTKRNTLLPQGLGSEAKIAHKTGDISSTLGDTGTVYLPNGKSYVVSVFVKRPNNDARAKSLIQEVSRTTYQYFQQHSPPSTTPQNNKTPETKPRSFLAE